MLSTELNNVVQNIDHIINLINGSKFRYRISIVPYQSSLVHILIINLSNEQVIYKNSIAVNNNEYVNFINSLRNKFIDHGAIISKLTTLPIKKETTYCEQEIYFNNLEMSIKINNKQEEISAAQAHKTIIEKKLQIFYKAKTKTIQPKKRVG